MSYTRAAVIAIAVGLVLVIAGQAVTGTMLSNQRGSVADATGRAGFAYLTGVRTFAAAVIWNRLEPIFHDYYQETPLSEQLNVVPMVHMVNWLDPQFVDGYYLSAWILFQRGDIEQAYAIAESGVENNPESATLRANYAQLLYLNGEIDEAVEQGKIALESAEWRSDEERFEGLRIFMSIFHKAGEDELHDQAAEEHSELKERFGLPATTVPHDHDGDGVADH